LVGVFDGVAARGYRDDAAVVERAWHDVELFGRGEHDRFFDIGAVGADFGFGSDRHRLRLRGGQPEGYFALCRSWRSQLEAEQLEEFDVVALGNSVEPVDEL